MTHLLLNAGKLINDDRNLSNTINKNTVNVDEQYGDDTIKQITLYEDFDGKKYSALLASGDVIVASFAFGKPRCIKFSHGISNNNVDSNDNLEGSTLDLLATLYNTQILFNGNQNQEDIHLE